MSYLNLQIVGTPIANDSLPNSVAPPQARVWVAPVVASGSDPGSGLSIVLKDGTSAVVQAWEQVDTGLWVQLGSQVQLAPGVLALPIAAQSNANVFLQVVSTVGSPTMIYAGYALMPNGVTSFYHATPSTRLNGQGGPLESTSTGGLATAETQAAASEDNTNGVSATAAKLLANGAYSPTTQHTNLQASAAQNVKATPGVLLGFDSANFNAAVRYDMWFDKVAAPVASDVPKISKKLSIAGTAGDSVTVGQELLTSNGWKFIAGIGHAVSTTAASLTIGASTDIITHASVQ